NVIPTTLHLLLSLYPTLRTHHSFPTRRSSDLTTLHEHNNDTCIGEDVPVLDGFPAEGMLRKQREDCLHRGKSDRKEEVNDHQSRSEEHTSELQSPDHLVCRLLLEQKKKTLTR